MHSSEYFESAEMHGDVRQIAEKIPVLPGRKSIFVSQRIVTMLATWSYTSYRARVESPSLVHDLSLARLFLIST
jgi:hypothetical protein